MQSILSRPGQPEPLRFGGAADLVGRRRWLANRWSLFRHHRQRIADVLCALANAAEQNLAVLGAGSCVDIDLSRLAVVYQPISLVDADGEALDHAPLLQPGIDFGTIHVHGGVDLTGLHEIFERWKSHPPDDARVADAISKAAWHRLPELGGDFHVVLSDCVLSQLIEQIVLAMGKSHPRLLAMITQVRQRHLELMLDLTAPGGYVVIANDVVSSHTAPILHTTPPEHLAQVMDTLIRARNFFTGCNPYAIKSDCDRSHLRQNISSISMLHPWLWRLQHDHVQLVACLIIRRRPI